MNLRSRDSNSELDALTRNLVHDLTSGNDISPAQRALLMECCVTRGLEKNTFLCREGEICRSLFFIHRGLARSFFHRDGKDVTSWIAFEGNFTAALRSMFHGEPAPEAIELMEHSIVTTLDYARFQGLFDSHPTLLRLGYNLMRDYFIQVDDRTVALQCNSAEERLRDLLESDPRVLERMPAYHIATYLGITPETLSRVRAKVFSRDS